MDSPEDGLSAPLLDSVTQDFKNLIPKKKNLEDLNWDNSFVRELPSDPRTDPFPREVALTFIQFISIQMKLGLQFTISLSCFLHFQVLHACSTKVSPSVQVDDPQLVIWSQSVADLLDLDNKESVFVSFSLSFYYIRLD
jgi:hypothetical protein